MSDQFDTVNLAIRDHLIAHHPQVAVSSMDGVRLPLGKVGGTRIWIRLGVRPGQRAFMRAMVAASARPGEPMPAWMSSLADAAARMSPAPLRQVLEPAARELPNFDQLELLPPAGFTEDKAWHWGPVVYTYSSDPPSMRAAGRCVAALLDGIRPLILAHVPGAATSDGFRPPPDPEPERGEAG
jgi:hypothetical protein